MNKGLVAENLLAGKDGTMISQVIGATVSARQVGRIFHITSGGALNIRVDLVADDVTVTTAITWKLQTSSGVDKDGADNWIDSSGDITVSGDGSTTAALNVQDTTNDEQYLPLRAKGRVVVTTSTTDTITVEQLRVIQAH